VIEPMTGVRDDLLAESRVELVRLLQSEIAAMGRITFARFMQHALYHPDFGYYATGGPRAGFQGDFLTGPETHAIFGHAVARQIAECWERLGRPEPFVVREQGAGSGTLARDVMSGLRGERPDVLAALRYEIGDVNETRVSRALELLRDAGVGEHARVAANDPFTGVLLANELLDAFPVHRLVFSDGQPREVYVSWREGWFADEVGPLSDERLAEPLTGLPLVEGQRMEVSPSAWDWAASLAATMERGYAILIDYGYPTAQLYHAAERGAGTLRAYARHLVSDDPYRRVALQDLTAHVDFGAVSRAAVRGGMVELGLTSQASFFAGLGIEELLMQQQTMATSPDEYISARAAVMLLLEPRGLGRFRVLVLGRRVDPAPPLRGLSFVLR
jgi:SAM-dependent MidA family methyltransferase